jgi:biopolymer transport protein ExbD
MSRGQIKTGEFKINVKSEYWIYVEVERKFDFDGVPCLLGFRFDECNNTPSVLKASWSLSERGRVVAQGSSDEEHGMLGGTRTMGRGIGAFGAGKGQHYALTVDILEDGSRLNVGNPRLRIEEIGGIYWQYDSRGDAVFLVAALGVVAGLILIIRSIIVQRENRGRRTVSLTEPGPQREEVHLGSRSGPPTPREAQTPRKGLRFRAIAWLGISSIFLGLASFATIQYWLGTRTFVAVNMPISLVPGHIKTGPFRINLNDWYTIWIDLDQNAPFGPNCSSYSVLHTRWALRRDGIVAQESDEPIIRDCFLGFLQAGKGTYDLEVEVLSDASCLNPRHPRLRVRTSKSYYTDSTGPVQWLSLLCAGAGMSLLALLGHRQLRGRSARAASFALSESPGQYFHFAQKFQLTKKFSGLPPFGLVAAIICFVGVFPLYVLKSPRPPLGLKVRVLKPAVLSMKIKSLTEPVVVRLKSGAPRKLYLNSRLVPLSALDVELKKELKLRPDWVVYFDADPDLPWEQAAEVIDLIRGAGAEVVLLTPGSQKSPVR